MKQKHLIFSLGIFLLILAGCGGGGGGSPPTSTCTDSDSGQNYDVAGQVILSDLGINSTFNDYCINANTLGEYYCSTSNYKAIVNYACSSGQCVNGACVSSGTPTFTCTDSDGGNNIYSYGSISGSNNLNGQPFSYGDTCRNATQLQEFYCLANQGGPGNSTINCPASYLCSNGVCLFDYGCTDSDNGANYNVQGIVSLNNGSSFTDVCLSGTSLREYYCGSGNVVSTTTTCGSGCSAGSCIVGPNATINSTCTDSDNGLNRLVKGYTNVTNSTGNFTLTDSCISGSQVKDYYCDISGNNSADYSILNCLAGETCSNGACIVNVTASCTDTDGGNNVYQRGTLNYANQTANISVVDSCNSGIQFVEHYCVGNSSYISYANNCPIDYACTNGACIYSPPNVSSSTCVDSDFGLNRLIKGTTSVTNSTGFFPFTDSCFSSTQVTDYYCYTSGNNSFASYSILNCLGNEICSNGVCITAPPGTCSGYVSLSLVPSTVNISQLVSPTALGLSNCTGKTIDFKQTSCTTGPTVSTCISGDSGCAGSNFIAPSSPGTYGYYACIDKNSDGDTSDTGEYGYRSLPVYNPNESCSDSDAGFNQYIVGTVNVVNNSGTFTFVDSCFSPTYVAERYCSANKAYSFNMNCPNGCLNGACVYVYGTSCTDPDGNDTLTTGTTTLTWSNGTIKQYLDYCYPLINTSLYEYYCRSSITNITGTPLQVWNANLVYRACPPSKFCQNGRCI